ncbi:unnamed protein product, partial [Staurois parvus]
MPTASAHQCHISAPISVPSVPHISAHIFSCFQCHPSVPVSGH